MQQKNTSQKINKVFFILISLVILVVIVTSLRKNIHVVVPHQVYRSAQLSPNALSVLIKDKKIRSIINLRGQNEYFTWYRNERKLSQLLGVRHFDIRLSAEQFPTKKQLQRLAYLIETTPKPVLIHCESGADRTGLASAMALLLLQNKPLNEVETAFSWRYLVTSGKTVGKQVFARYRKWLSTTHLPSSKNNFKHWLNEVA